MNATLVKQETNLASQPKLNQSLTKDRFLPVSSASMVKSILLRDAVEQLIQSVGNFMLKDVRYLVEDGVVLLLGSIPSFYLKQILQTAVMKAVKDLKMDYRVQNYCQVEYVSNENSVF